MGHSDVLQRTGLSYTTPPAPQLQVSACFGAKGFNTVGPHCPSTAAVRLPAPALGHRWYTMAKTPTFNPGKTMQKGQVTQKGPNKKKKKKSTSAGKSSLSKPRSNVLHSKVINGSLTQDTNEKICQKQNSVGRTFPLVFGTRPE